MVKPARTALATTGKKSYPQLPRNVQRTAKAICYVDLVWLLSLLAPRARDTEVPAAEIFLSLSLSLSPDHQHATTAANTKLARSFPQNMKILQLWASTTRRLDDIPSPSLSLSLSLASIPWDAPG
jgi:hypothetical protein